MKNLLRPAGSKWQSLAAIALRGCHHVRFRELTCAVFFILHFSVFIPAAKAQFNTDRLLMVGRSALYYEDYVLSIQYFNQAISAKPYLYEPWFFRSLAKYYLDDFAGAEADVSQALERNPYVVNCYELRGMARIRQKKYAGAVADYTRALRYEPDNKGLWHNRVLCRIKQEQYDSALCELDTMLGHWASYAPAHNMRAEVFMAQKDTARAIEALDRSLELDPYDGHTWAARSIISLSRQEWLQAEQQLSKSIHLLPKRSDNYVNRALARYNMNNLRGAMNDYDTAIDLDPNSFIGHYNRGLLRAQVGDDNRAITDFDFVLRMEPGNTMARFNRGVLRAQTGDLRGAIDDYTKVIDEYPNFLTGLSERAECYRKLGMRHQAERDEFRVLQAQLDRRAGKKPKPGKRQTRKRGDTDDPEKYNQLVVADEQELSNEYQSVYRGRVQNRHTDEQPQTMYMVSTVRPKRDVSTYVAYDRSVDSLARQGLPLYLSTRQPQLSEEQSASIFSAIDSLTRAINTSSNTPQATSALLQRSMAYATTQNYQSAIDDLTTYLLIDSTSVVALWQRAACQDRVNEFQASEGTDVRMKTANVLVDLEHAARLAPGNAFILYNRGCIYLQRADYAEAEADFTRALAIDARLAEAHYNRALCRLRLKNTAGAVADLSKAGELGIYTAYALIKKHTATQNGD